MSPYVHKVQYYETDMMGIAHHANYIRWMEEARIDFMERLGYPYARMEREGLVSPVRSVSCSYRRPCTFGDEIRIEVTVAAFNGVVLTIRYAMRNAADEVVCEAVSEHVFLHREDGRMARLKREQPDFCRAIEAAVAPADEAGKDGSGT